MDIVDPEDWLIQTFQHFKGDGVEGVQIVSYITRWKQQSVLR